jgi:hypothetical protein
VFQGGDSLCLLQTVRISRVEETHVSLQRKPCMLEAAESSALFHCENGVSFRMRYFLEGGFFKVESALLIPNSPVLS